VSGGSYNYLCHADADDILRMHSSLRSMADRLDELCPEAAAETRAIFDGPGSLYAELEARIARLKGLWKAVEWRDSCDWSEDQLTAAVEEFRVCGPAPGALVSEVDRIRRIAELTGRAARLLAEAERIGVRAWMTPPPGNTR